MIRLILTLLTLCAGPLVAGEPLDVITLEQVKTGEFDGKDVAVRGFLYRALDGRWILATEPNLKSCCIGTPIKKAKQLVVLGDFADQPAGKVVTVSGRLVDGSIGEAKLVPDTHSDYCPLCFVALAVLSGSVFAIYRFRSRG